MISVIIPVKNGAKYLERALISVLTQDYSDYEIIVCDGGSTDGTKAILEKYKLPIVSSIDEGPGDAINKGVALAKGDIVTWLMHDDELLSGALKTVAQFFKEDPKVNWAFAPMDLVNKEGSVAFTMGEDSDVTLEKMTRGNKVPGVSVYLRKEIFIKYGGFNPKIQFADDYDFWCRMLLGGEKAIQIPHKLVVYHITGENRGMRKEAQEEGEKVRDFYSSYLPGGINFGKETTGYEA